MGFYQRVVLPRLLDRAMRDHHLASYRSHTIVAAEGLVLEIGAGSGLNFPCYPEGVARVVALDPSPALLRLAAGRGGAARVSVSLLRGAAERLPFAEAVFDTIVTTWTLCSLADPVAALREARRVLRPGGRLLFVEHGLAPTKRIAVWQHRLTPCWRAIAGGCHLDRRIDALIRAAGFRIESLETGHMPGPQPWTFMYQGSVVR
ncbi:MAG: class I SAM-dependent methyltransferase [Alphaproteobacteria bacterium]